MQPEAVDLSGRDDLHRDASRACRSTARKSDSRSSGSSCFESFSRAERGKPAAAQILVVEQDGRRDERPGEAATTCLVRPRDEAGAETPVERDEPAAAAARRRQSRPRPRLRAHRARITSSAAVSRGRAPSYPLSRASSTAWRGSRRRSPARRSSRSSASGAGRCARRRSPNDCLRTVNVSRTPAPWRLMTMPSKTWTRRRWPSITWKWTRTVSPALKFGIDSRSCRRSMVSMKLLMERRPGAEREC